MSKTYNDKYDFQKIIENDEINYWDAYLLTTRHPNKRKRASLNREFHKVNLGSPANWKNRFGEVYDKSSRMHLAASEIAMKRRRRLNHDAQDEINRELNNI